MVIGPFYALAIASLLSYTCSAPAQQKEEARPFPDYKLIPGKSLDEFNPTSAARLCLTDGSHKCFALPQLGKGNEAFFYYAKPTVRRVVAASGETLVLFSAGFQGGSGGSDEYVLLRFQQGKLINLLPAITLSNQSNHDLWDLPAISPMPLFVTADFLWEDGAHYGDHHYQIEVYSYDSQTSKYKRILRYRTPHRYRGFDNSEDDTVQVLRYERATIESKLASLQSDSNQ